MPGEWFIWGDIKDVGPYASMPIRLLGDKVHMLGPGGRVETHLLDENAVQIPNPCHTENPVLKYMNLRPRDVIARTLKSIPSL